MTIGRDLLFQMLEHYRVDYIFGNPGTMELPLIDGAYQHPEIRYISALHEAIAVGMAMGYARHTGKHGVVILHVAPGLANGMGNLYNAYRAGLPLVVLAGQHHSRLLLEEPILAGDHVGMVKSMTKWAHEVRHIDELPLALHRAFKVAITPPTGPVFLSIPYDIALQPTPVEHLPAPTRIAADFCASEAVLKEIAVELFEAERPLILVGDGVGAADALEEASQLALLVGAGVMGEPMPTCQNFDSRKDHFLGTLPNRAKNIREALAKHDLILFAGVNAQAAVPLFDDRGPLLPPESKIVYLHHNPWEMGKNHPGGLGAWGELKSSLAALVEIARSLSAPYLEKVTARLARVREESKRRKKELADQLDRELGDGLLTARTVAGTLNRCLPEDGRFSVVNEGVSNAIFFNDYLDLWEAKQYTAGKGGGLGHGIAQALGIALAEPSRRVVSVTGEGTLLYYPQVFYTAYQTKARLLYLILNNKSYRILKMALKSFGPPLGERELECLNLDQPFDIIQLARSFGLQGERVSRLADLEGALKRGLSYDGPYVLDVAIL